MNRRRFLAGLGTVSAGSLGVVGTGAFSSTSAGRVARIAMVRDDDAYLRLTASDTDFAYTDRDGLLVFEFNGDFRDYAGGTETGDGLGTDSVYEFASLFNVENQGMNDVRVFGRYDETGGMATIELFDSQDSARAALTEESPSKPLTPGRKLKVGMRIDTDGVDLGDYQETITIGAAIADGSGN